MYITGGGGVRTKHTCLLPRATNKLPQCHQWLRKHHSRNVKETPKLQKQAHFTWHRPNKKTPQSQLSKCLKAIFNQFKPIGLQYYRNPFWGPFDF